MNDDNKVDGKGENKEWSVMVYLAGGKDVSDEALESLLRMKQVGSTKNVHVIAQFDSGSEGTYTKRYQLQPLKNALDIGNLLIQACTEISVPTNPSDYALATYYFERLMETLPEDRRKDFQSKHQAKEMTELLKNYPYGFKSLILDFLLDADLDVTDGNIGETNAGDPKVLVKFVDWAMENYPSYHTLVIIWGHGSGLSVAWDFPAPTSFSTPDSLTVMDLSEAFKAIHKIKKIKKIDIVGFNSCSLGTIEVYRELKDYVSFGVASEGFTPKTSWPYEKILKALKDEPEMLPGDFAQKIVDKYINYYKHSVNASENLQEALRNSGIRDLNTGLDLNKEPALSIAKGPNLSIAKGPNLSIAKGPNLSLEVNRERRGIDLSVCELEKSIGVASEFKKLVALLLQRLKPVDSSVLGAILGAHAISQSYFNKDFTDLYDFCRALQSFCHDHKVRAASEKVMEAVGEMCKKKGKDKNYVGEDVRNSNGVSIFFPWDDWGRKDLLTKYKDLEFLKETNWHEFLKHYRALVDNFVKEKQAFAAKP